jgi:DNA-binding MurR/RpiR family transcriptional regulator
MRERTTEPRSRTASSDLTLDARFAQHRHRLGTRRQQLLEAILESAEETFFLSSRELAKRMDVDAATIVRTIQAIGYPRYADFAADLRRYFLAKITPYAVLRAETKEGRSLGEHIGRSLKRDVENVTELEARLDRDAVKDLARRIHQSRDILVVGVDLAAALSWLLAYGLVPLGFKAEAAVGSSGNLQHKVRVLGPHDLLVAISFGRCLRDTVEAVLSARARSVPTFGITDSPVTPIARYCDRYLLASVGSPLYTGSYAAPVALINAIFMACSQTRPSRALQRLRQTEEEYASGSRYYEETRRR